MTSARPLAKSSLKELQELIDASSYDPARLPELADELRHRSSAGARSLLRRVERRLKSGAVAPGPADDAPVSYRAELRTPSATIHLRTAERIGFASQQNSVPPIVELAIENTGDRPLGDLSLTLTSDPPFLGERSWRFDRIAPGETARPQDRDVAISATYTLGLHEAERGTVLLALTDSDGLELARVRRPIELLAADEWGGAAATPELLAAFVTPNEPAVDRVLRLASDALAASGAPDAINGYESNDTARVHVIVSAIWSAVSNLQLAYALPPASFESQGQKVRSPGAILDGRMATCLDTALLFAAAIEQAGLHALVVLTPGHAFAGAWLVQQQSGQLITDDPAQLRNRVDLREAVVFETTLATGANPARFSDACAEARRQMEALSDGDFYCAVDVKRARMQRIWPLNMAGGATSAPEQAVEQRLFVESPPAGLGGPTLSDPEAAAASTPGGRMVEWQRKLLDLTARNRLLNLPKAGTVALLCPRPDQLEDALAGGADFTIRPLPELAVGGRDAELHRQRERTDLAQQHAAEALARKEVLVDGEAKPLEATLVKLYRQARSDLAEGGANTLFLALGFLDWRKADDDAKRYRAPLILVPVELKRRSARADMKLSAHEDGARFNTTLLELLRQDFGLEIGGLDGELPQDDSGVDVRGVWDRVRRAIRDTAGFEVREDVVLGIFSFSKYLMWKDLVDRTDSLRDNPVVRLLLDRQGEPGALGFEPIAAADLDRRVDPADLFAPLPADSSQLAAVVASGEGCNLVLDGPPGTGKSQTIANMIAHNLALGRRVLFVSEKRAALEVVYRRLEQVGLGDFALELHSHKSTKSEVLRQLDRAWAARGDRSPDEWAAETTRLRALRDELNDYVRALHRRHGNGWSVHDAIWRVVRDGDEHMPVLGLLAGTEHGPGEVAAMRDLARRLELTFADLGPLGETVRRHVRAEEWTNAWQARLLGAAARLDGATEVVGTAADRLATAIDLSLTHGSPDDLPALIVVADAVLAAHGLDVGFALAPGAEERIVACRSLVETIAAWRARAGELSTGYGDPTTAEAHAPELAGKWDAAAERFWFFETLARRRVARDLGSAGQSDGPADPERDLPILMAMAEHRAEAERLDGVIGPVRGVDGLSTDPDHLNRLIRTASDLRAMLTTTASLSAASPSAYAELAARLRALVVDANDLLAPGAAIDRAAERLCDAAERFAEVRAEFVDASAASELPPTFIAVRALCRELADSAPRLNALCQWNEARAAALACALNPLIDRVEGGLERGTAVALFDVAYARWFAAWAIDAEPLLARFNPRVHEDRIIAFRALTTEVGALTAKIVRARLCAGLPAPDSVAKSSGFGILKHELAKQRRHKPVRQLAEEMGADFTRLAPCMLMSPLSIAQYLPANSALFDIVIFDEASQITPWDAVGSIGRGRQLVVAGDQKQMPPTTFFSRGTAAALDDEELEDLESILDECVSASIPRRSLDWHYRSRHDSLIAFSNNRYYGNRLVTFPAPETRDSAVHWHRVEGVYTTGVKTNPIEAKAIVAEVRRRLASVAPGAETLGVVTLNSEQQSLVEDLLEAERRGDPAFDAHFADDLDEPVFVKNLETVQGDERDTIVLGIGFGPTEPGSPKMSMNFGPLNKEGGWRRLNVAVTRARREMLVFTSFDPSMIDLSRTSAEGVRVLRTFIEFADRGSRSLAERHDGSVGPTESPFEDAVMAALTRRGWIVRPQIGVSGFRIDLGVVHPDRPGDFLAGVECDGAMYHSALTARDRDQVRQAVLEGLGWRIVRIWSTDFWVDKRAAIERVDGWLRTRLEADRTSIQRPNGSVGHQVQQASEGSADPPREGSDR